MTAPPPPQSLPLRLAPSSPCTTDPTIPIDLLRGHPTTRLLATPQILTATTKILTNSVHLPTNSLLETRHPLAYGPDFGNLNLRQEISAWTSEKYGEEYIPDDLGRGAENRINMTCGASYGLMNALQQFTSPGTGYTRRAFVVSPTYFLACSIFMGMFLSFL